MLNVTNNVLYEKDNFPYSLSLTTPSLICASLYMGRLYSMLLHYVTNALFPFTLIAPSLFIIPPSLTLPTHSFFILPPFIFLLYPSSFSLPLPSLFRFLLTCSFLSTCNCVGLIASNRVYRK